MKILVTGAYGLLGTDLCERLSKQHEVIAVGHNSGEQRVDIGKGGEVMRLYADAKPDFVINNAAYCDVDGCERNPELSEHVNVVGTCVTARLAGEWGIPYLYVSTDCVFDGTKSSPYLETDAPNPITVYGSDKLKGEQATAQFSKKHYIARTSLLFGKQRKTFATVILESARDGKPIKAAKDITGTPSSTKDVADAIAKMIELQPEFGIYHVVNSGYGTRLELAQETLKIAGLTADLEAVNFADLNSAAKRPPFSALSNEKLASIGIKMRDWREALADFVRESTE